VAEQKESDEDEAARSAKSKSSRSRRSRRPGWRQRMCAAATGSARRRSTSGSWSAAGWRCPRHGDCVRSKMRIRVRGTSDQPTG